MELVSEIYGRTFTATRDNKLCFSVSVTDLVVAYKSQIKENETLQATVKSLRAACKKSKKQTAGPSSSHSQSEEEGSTNETEDDSEVQSYYEYSVLRDTMLEMY